MICSKTPFRFSFIGGGSDLPFFYRQSTGRVISSTINKYLYIYINKSFYNSYNLSYKKKENVLQLNQIKHPLVRESLRIINFKDSVEISSMADIPKGTGLGSSSTFTVGLIKALMSYSKKDISPTKLANIACKVEIEKCHQKIGKQDQYAAAYGGLNKFEFYPNETVKRSKINLTTKKLKELSESLLFFYTGSSRSSSNILSKISSSKVSNNYKILKNMTFLVNDFSYNLENFDLKNLGEILHSNWSYKKELTRDISNKYIDECYNLALKSGAYGGKLAGAGKSGFLVFIAEKKDHQKIKKRLNKLHYVDIQLSELGSTSFKLT